MPPALGAWSLNCWTSRLVPYFWTLNSSHLHTCPPTQERCPWIFMASCTLGTPCLPPALAAGAHLRSLGALLFKHPTWEVPGFPLSHWLRSSKRVATETRVRKAALWLAEHQLPGTAPESHDAVFYLPGWAQCRDTGDGHRNGTQWCLTLNRTGQPDKQASSGISSESAASDCLDSHVEMGSYGNNIYHE